MKGRTNSPRHPISFRRNAGQLSQLNTSLNRHEATLFNELVERLDRLHLIKTSRSYASKFSMAVALHFVRKAEEDGTYAEIAQIASDMLQAEKAGY